jgi:FG-GAP-like repeat
MNGLQTAGEGRVAVNTNDWHIQGVSDFNGDFNSDILWRQDTGQVFIWEMNGLQIKEEGSPPHALVTNDWHIEGTGDFDGDFKSDILWRHDSGQVYLWEMDGLNVKAEGSVTHAPVTNDWHVQGVGDFNGDGNSDVLWRQDGSGQVYVWGMVGRQVQAEGAVEHAPVTSDWHVQGIGDFNGDGNSDVLWRQDGSGQVYVWEMNGRQVQAEGAVEHAPVTSDWHVESVNDFNGDGNSDVLWRQDGSGQVYVWEMNGRQVQDEGAVQHAPVPSDWHVFSDLNFI